MSVAAELVTLFKGDISDLENKTKDAEGIGGKLGAAFGKVGPLALAGATVAVGAVAGIGMAAVGVGQQFDDALDTLRSATGATGPELDKLGESMRNITGTVPEDVGKVSGVMAELASRTGQTGPQLEALTQQTLALARVTGGDAQASVAGLTRMLGDASVPAEQQAAALDTVFKASQQTGVGFDRLSGLMVAFGAPMRNLGMSLEESAALLGRFEKEGVNTELVMGALKAASAKWAKEGLAPAEGLQQTIEKMQALGPGAEATALAMETFGQKAGGDMVDTILAGKFAIDDLVNSIAGSEETIMTAADATAGFGEKWATTKNKIAIAVEPLGTMLLDAATKGLDALAPLLDQFTTWLPGAMASFQQTAGPIMDQVIAALASVDWAGMFAIAQQAIGQFVAGLQILQPVLATVFGFLLEHKETVVAVGVAIAALAAGPVTLVVGAIVGLVALLPTLSAAWDDLKAAVGTLASELTAKWNEITTNITTALSSIVTAITTKWQEARDAVTQKLEEIRSTIQLQWDAFLRTISEKLDAILGAVETAWESVRGAIEGALNAVRDIVTSIWAEVQDRIANALDDINGKIQDVLALIEGTFNIKLSWIRDFVDDVFSGLIGVVTGRMDIVRNAIDNVLEDIRNLFETGLNVAEKVREKIDEVKKAIDEKAAAILTAAQTIGTNIIEGIAGQVEKMKDELKRRLSAIWDQIPQWIKDILGIHSPSTVFEGIARDSGLGYIVGWQKVMPAILQAVRSGAMEAAETFRRTIGRAWPGVGAGAGGGGGFAGGGDGTGSGIGLPGMPGMGSGSGLPGNQYGRASNPPNSANLNRTGRGGFRAGSATNFWQQWVDANGGTIPDEADARSWSSKLGLQIPPWLEEAWKGLVGGDIKAVGMGNGMTPGGQPRPFRPRPGTPIPAPIIGQPSPFQPVGGSAPVQSSGPVTSTGDIHVDPGGDVVLHGGLEVMPQLIIKLGERQFRDFIIEVVRTETRKMALKPA